MDKLIYRELIQPEGLVSFRVAIKESDLFILSTKKLEKEAEEALIWCRKDIEEYIYRNPLFKTSFEPLPLDDRMPPIVREMTLAGQRAGVGPMAAVAGAIAEGVGKKLLEFSPEVIVENGGDIFMKIRKERTVGIYAGNSPLSLKLALKISPPDTPLGVCCSSGTIGHSRSFGLADAVIILSSSTSLADALATAVGNMVKEEKDIKKGLEFIKDIWEVKGGLIIKGRRMGAWGKLNLSRV